MRMILQGGGLLSGSGGRCRGTNARQLPGWCQQHNSRTCVRQRQEYHVCVGYNGVGMLTDAAALTNGLSMAIDGLRVVGGVVCAGGVSFGGRFSSQIENLLP